MGGVGRSGGRLVLVGGNDGVGSSGGRVPVSGGIREVSGVCSSPSPSRPLPLG